VTELMTGNPGLLAPEPPFEDLGTISLPGREAASNSADAENMKRDISTKASFVLALSSASSTQSLFIYFRWYNTKHPELAGPWSALMTTMIL